MDSIETYADRIVVFLQTLQGLPADAFVLVSCLVVGYILRLIKKFPNDGIPLAVILWGAVIYPLLQDARNQIPFRIWLVRGVLFGAIIGSIAWFVHKKWLSKLEDKWDLFPSKKESSAVAHVAPPSH